MIIFGGIIVIFGLFDISRKPYFPNVVIVLTGLTVMGLGAVT